MTSNIKVNIQGLREPIRLANGQISAIDAKYRAQCAKWYRKGALAVTHALREALEDGSVAPTPEELREFCSMVERDLWIDPS